MGKGVNLVPFGCLNQQYFRELLVEQRRINSLPFRIVVILVLMTPLSISSVAFTEIKKNEGKKI